MNQKKKQETSIDEDSFFSEEESKNPLLKSFEGESVDLTSNESLFGESNPYEESGIFSRWLFNWVSPLVSFGYGSKIKLDNLGALPSEYHWSIQETRVNNYWRELKHKKGYPLIWAIWKAYKGEFMYAFFLSFLSSIPDIASPFIIQRFLVFIENKDDELWIGIVLAIVYVISVFVSRILMEQGTFYQMQLGSKWSAGVIGLIYNKSLKISSATNKRFTQGEIVNFIQVDARKIILFAGRLPNLTKLPFILIYSIIMCFYYRKFQTYCFYRYAKDL